MRQPLNRFGAARVVAPFAFQPTRRGLRGGFGGLGIATAGPPIGAGAGAGAEIGAAQGASYGSVAGPIGTVVGTVIGAIGGAIAGSIDKKDPEQYDFDQAVALWQQNRLSVLAIGDKYLVLAGLFDLNLNNPHIPIYQKYGHMGEQKFVTDMVNVIYNAAMSGQITATDTPNSVMSRIVQPWIDSWGYGPMVDPHADLINLILLGMVTEYIAGQQGNWLARSGGYPFGSLPAFPLQTVLAASNPTPAPSVNPVGSTVPVTTPPVTQATTPIVATQPAAPSYSASGTVVTPSYPSPMITPAGTFSAQWQTFLMNGAPVATWPTTAGLAYVNGQVYRYDANGGTFVWNNGWQATNQAPAPGNIITSAIQSTAPSTNTINPVGSTTTTPLTPAQLVASTPAIGAAVQYAPDMGANGAATALQAGLTYAGKDPYNGSWILQNTASGQPYVVWQGVLEPYTSTLFAPATAAAAPTTTTSSVAPNVTGGGSSGVYSGTSEPLSTDQTGATTTPAPAATDTSWLLPVALIGGLVLLSGRRKRH